MIISQDKYFCKCNEEDPIKAQIKFYKSLGNEARLQQKKTDDNPYPFDFSSEGRQTFTTWNWAYPHHKNLRSKTYSIKYEKSLSPMERLLLNNFQKKYLYHAITDILDSLKSQPIECDNLLAILYSVVFSLQNNFSIDFFDIWIDEIYMHKMSKSNKFLTNDTLNVEPFSYITIKLIYNKKLLPQKSEAFW